MPCWVHGKKKTRVVLVVACWWWGCYCAATLVGSAAFLLGPSDIGRSTPALRPPHYWIKPSSSPPLADVVVPFHPEPDKRGHTDILRWKSVTRPSLLRRYAAAGAGALSSSYVAPEESVLEIHRHPNDDHGAHDDTADPTSVFLNEDLLSRSMQALGWDDAVQQSLRECLREAGFENDTNNNNDLHASSSSSSSFDALVTVCRDYPPSEIAHMLRNDFHIRPTLRAHQLRATIVQAWRLQETQDQEQQRHAPPPPPPPPPAPPTSDDNVERLFRESASDGTLRSTNSAISAPIDDATSRNNDTTAVHPILPQRPLYKSVQVNTAAARRKQNRSNATYGLLDDYSLRHPLLAHNLDQFWEFMTRPTPLAQEEPIRPATATVYMRHAKLYLGWYLRHHRRTPSQVDNDTAESNDAALSLSSVFPSPDAAAVAPLIDFVLWLRSERSISASYEANVLRGLSKLVKFRFAHSSTAPQSSSSTTHAYDDVPLVLELRKLHRVANRQQRLSPRSSNEQRKWISWPEYLGVVEACRVHALQLLQHTPARENPVNPETAVTPQERSIAVALQRYLVLAIFANVPDRQRTVRELEVGRTLMWDEASNCWCIRHAPQDYKTGKTYGERPPLQLPVSLSETLSTFHQHWRLCLRPVGAPLFVQPRTGKPLTSDSVYQLVSRACYEHTGRRTNPHLLRDMIVTHVRDASQASETELEALALFMGHSLHMQRTSYDRRTLTRKVAPAVQLLEAVNRKGAPQSLSPPPNQ